MPDDVKLRDIIIPATHDSNTTNLEGKLLIPFSLCQKLNIYEQLNFGVRYLDLRYCMNTEKLLKKMNINKEAYTQLSSNYKMSFEKLIDYSKVRN